MPIDFKELKDNYIIRSCVELLVLYGMIDRPTKVYQVYTYKSSALLYRAHGFWKHLLCIFDIFVLWLINGRLALE